MQMSKNVRIMEGKRKNGKNALKRFMSFFYVPVFGLEWLEVSVYRGLPSDASSTAELTA